MSHGVIYERLGAAHSAIRTWRRADRLVAAPEGPVTRNLCLPTQWAFSEHTQPSEVQDLQAGWFHWRNQWKALFLQGPSEGPGLPNKSSQFWARQRFVRVPPADASPGRGSCRPAKLAKQEPVGVVFLASGLVVETIQGEAGLGSMV